MKLRVLVSAVVLSQPMGGVRRHNAHLLPLAASLLLERGGSLAVLEGREKIAFALPDSVERIASSVPAHPVLVRATLEGRALRAALDAAREAKHPFDLVHTGHLPVPRALKTPYSVTIHDLRALELEHTPMSRRLIARKLIGNAVDGAAAVITVSEQVREQVLARFPRNAGKIHVVPNAADHFEPLPRRLLDDAPLLHVGHVERRKNLELLLRAIALDPGLPRLRLAGESKLGEEQRLRDLAAELGVADRVEFIGGFEDGLLAELYASAAAVVIPSQLEGFGIPVLEAQRARVPVAISRAGALLEIAGPDTPSFAPDDPAECAHAIRAALATPARELDAAALRSQRFTWKDSAARLVAAWETAVQQAAP
ncbi:MAG: glycosyltransferase family 1 protein [Planctomycetota bacterium]